MKISPAFRLFMVVAMLPWVLGGLAYALRLLPDPSGAASSAGPVMGVLFVVYLVLGLWWWRRGVKHQEKLQAAEEEAVQSAADMVTDAVKSGDYSALEEWAGVTIQKAEVERLAKQLRGDPSRRMSKNAATWEALRTIVMRDMPEDHRNLPAE